MIWRNVAALPWAALAAGVLPASVSWPALPLAAGLAPGSGFRIEPEAGLRRRVRPGRGARAGRNGGRCRLRDGAAAQGQRQDGRAASRSDPPGSAGHS